MTVLTYLKRKYSPEQLKTVLSTIYYINELEKTLRSFSTVEAIEKITIKLNDAVYVHIMQSRILNKTVAKCELVKAHYSVGNISFTGNNTPLDDCVCMAFKHGFLGNKVSVYNVETDELIELNGYIKNSKDDDGVVTMNISTEDIITGKEFDNECNIINFSGKDISNKYHGLNSLPKCV